MVQDRRFRVAVRLLGRNFARVAGAVALPGGAGGPGSPSGVGTRRRAGGRTGAPVGRPG